MIWLTYILYPQFIIRWWKSVWLELSKEFCLYLNYIVSHTYSPYIYLTVYVIWLTPLLTQSIYMVALLENIPFSNVLAFSFTARIGLVLMKILISAVWSGFYICVFETGAVFQPPESIYGWLSWEVVSGRSHARWPPGAPVIPAAQYLFHSLAALPAALPSQMLVDLQCGTHWPRGGGMWWAEMT